MKPERGVMNMCEEQVHNGYSVSFHRCFRVAVVCDNGKWHYRQHSAAETEKRRAVQDAKWDAEVEKSKKRAAKLKEAQRRAECFPYMLAALKKVREDVNWMLNNRQCLNANMFDYLDAALAKAEEEA